MNSLNEKEKLLTTIIIVVVLLFPSNYILATQSVFLSEKIFISIWTSFLIGFFSYAFIDKNEELKKYQKRIYEND